jgi:hypothetical protein
MNIAFEVSLFILQSDFLHAVKSCNIEPMTSLPSKGVCAADFYRLKNPSPWLGMNLRTVLTIKSLR